MEQLTLLVRAQYPNYLFRIILLSFLEVAVFALLFLFTKPYFESYQVFWYVLCVVMVPACACSVAVNGLTKIATQVMIQTKTPHLCTDNDTYKPSKASVWQYISWKIVLLMVFCAVGIALCYSESAQTFNDLILLFVAIAVAIFLFANWIIIKSAVPLSLAVVRAFQYRRCGLDENQSVIHMIRFYFLPWTVIATGLLFTFFVKYYIGLADENGFVDARSVVKSTYISGALVAIWLWVEVGQMARLERVLGFVKLREVGHLTQSEEFSLVMAVPLILATLIAACNGFFDIESYRYQSAIAVSMLSLLVSASTGIGVAIIKLSASKSLNEPLGKNT